MEDKGTRQLAYELGAVGINWEDTLHLMIPLDQDEDCLELAQWVSEHQQATLQEIRKEMHRILRKRAI